MDEKHEGLVRLIDEALALAHERLKAERSGLNDPSSIELLEQIIFGLKNRREEAATSGFPVYDSYVTLGLGRLAAENEPPDSELGWRMGESEDPTNTNHHHRRR